MSYVEGLVELYEDELIKFTKHPTARLWIDFCTDVFGRDDHRYYGNGTSRHVDLNNFLADLKNNTPLARDTWIALLKFRLLKS